MRAYLGIILLTFFMIGCAPQPEINRDNLLPGEDIVSVAQGTQYSHGRVSIGVVNVEKDSATLAITVEAENPEAQSPSYVRETLAIGETTTADSYTIKVLQTKLGIGGFMPGQSSGSVTLQVTPI